MISCLKCSVVTCSLALVLMFIAYSLTQKSLYSEQRICSGGRLCLRGAVLPQEDLLEGSEKATVGSSSSPGVRNARLLQKDLRRGSNKATARHSSSPGLRRAKMPRIDRQQGSKKAVSDLSSPDLPSIPFPSATLSANTLLDQKWAKDLQQILLDIGPPSSSPIFTVTCNYKYRDVLLNWLIAAKTKIDRPLTRLIVFSLDRELWELLTKHNISSLLVEPKSFMKGTTSSVFYLILIIRITLIRLLNYWGYDAANVDSDAVILKNPEQLFSTYEDSDLVASHGTFPFDLGREWGATICGGMFLTRSTRRTEKFWNKFSQTLRNAPQKTGWNDQVKLNNALEAMQPDWEGIQGKSIIQDEWIATTPSGFKVTILPSKYICRLECKAERVDEYYIWHKGGHRQVSGKIAKLSNDQVNLWFLREDWEERENSALTGEDWLKEITVQ